ncbi:hypothetical protein CEXT_371261 [Caerostris extrusa]|uniref:Uncharacterized protein n=1 Tax=Caerostris extrusa TaxID=172846 RepID=A0AAV4T7M9_CAEEX|nr:hypothetical protein CEXT_371261 [Caerostris extrusa]
MEEQNNQMKRKIGGHIPLVGGAKAFLGADFERWKVLSQRGGLMVLESSPGSFGGNIWELGGVLFRFGD